MQPSPALGLDLGPGLCLCLDLDQQRWSDFVSENLKVFRRFSSSESRISLFVSRGSGGLRVGLRFPADPQVKVVCVSRTSSDVITEDNVTQILTIQEVPGDDVMLFMVAQCEQLTCPLLSHLVAQQVVGMAQQTVGVAQQAVGVAQQTVGVAQQALGFLLLLKNQMLVMKEKMKGRSFLAPPDCLHDDNYHLHDDRLHDNRLHDNLLHDDDHLHDDDDRLHDDDYLYDNAEGRNLLQACESSIVEWAELVSDVLRDDWSQQVVSEGLKPLPSEGCNFWRTRLENLVFIQQQLMSRDVQRVAFVVRRTDSVYWSTLRAIRSEVRDGLREARDLVQTLDPLQDQLDQLDQLDYQQLGSHMTAVMQQAMRIRSEVYREPTRLVVLLQGILNLLIHKSRNFLSKQEVMRGLGSDPDPGLDDVRLVIRTLQTLKEDYSQTSTRMDQQDSLDWDCPSVLVFIHLDKFLFHLNNLQEVLCVCQQLLLLDSVVLSSSDVVQVHQDFLVLVQVLSESSCDPSDPDDQSFQLLLDQFWVQVLDLQSRLVSVLIRDLEESSTVSSAAKLLRMFGFILDRPLIQDQLHPHLPRLVDLVLVDLDQIEQLVYSQRESTQTSRTRLCWTQQLRLRTQDLLDHYTSVQHLDLDLGDSQPVLQRFQQILDLLQDSRDLVVQVWVSELDSDCELILDQPLIERNQQGMLGVGCSHKLQVVFRDLLYLSRQTDIKLRPLAARLFSCRHDITQSMRSLSHMTTCYNQVISRVLQVEFPLIQDQLQDLNQNLLHLERNTWSCAGLMQLVEQRSEVVLNVLATLSQARANMDAMTRIIQGWTELQLLQRSGDALLGGGASEEDHRRLREEGEELQRLTQVNMSLYGAGPSETWTRFLDHVDLQVHNGLEQLLLGALHFLSDSMTQQSVLLCVSLQLQETGSVFKPSVGSGLSDFLQSVIGDVYAAANQPPRISAGRHGDYQATLRQSPQLAALEQEVMRGLLQVREEAESLAATLDRYAYLWRSDREEVLQEFLTYGRHLGPEELDPEEATPTLDDFHRELESLDELRSDVIHLDDVIVLHGWLQVNLRPFRDRLLSIIRDRTRLYTDHLLDSVQTRLQQLTGGDDDDGGDEDSLTDSILLLEAAGVRLPEHLAAQLQC